MSRIHSKFWKAFLSRSTGWVMWAFTLGYFGMGIYLREWLGALVAAATLCLLTFALSWEAENRGFEDKEP